MRFEFEFRGDSWVTNRVLIERAGLCKVLLKEPVIYGSKSVCIEVSFVSSDFGEANKRTRKYRGDPKNGEKPCAADHDWTRLD